MSKNRDVPSSPSGNTINIWWMGWPNNRALACMSSLLSGRKSAPGERNCNHCAGLEGRVLDASLVDLLRVGEDAEAFQCGGTPEAIVEADEAFVTRVSSAPVKSGSQLECVGSPQRVLHGKLACEVPYLLGRFDLSSMGEQRTEGALCF